MKKEEYDIHVYRPQQTNCFQFQRGHKISYIGPFTFREASHQGAIYVTVSYTKDTYVLLLYLHCTQHKW